MSIADFEIRSLPGLWRWYDRESRTLAFGATSAAEAEDWQAALRQQLTRLLGGFPAERCDLTPTLVESVDAGDHRRDLLVLQTLPGEYLPVYVLTPYNATAPYKPVIALHGHGSWGARSIVGIDDSPEAAAFSTELHYDYARRIARMGYQVFAPELRGFGVRMEYKERALQAADPTALWVSSCERVSLNALMSGKTLMGLRVWDVMRLIDYVQALPDVQPGSLACVGLSGGGTLTMYTAALDTRITCAYSSGAVNTFRDSILSIDHCLCNYVPGILEYAEMDEIAGLIAPRPLMVENGLSDPIYPPHGVEAAAATLRRVYACFGADDRFMVHSFDGPHRWDGALTEAWLARWL
ncbi:MAG: acetylxylan esterase [Anaerolineae bacterium]|nr:acetylxylan esterase [Anaerolineae bacterium]